nr:transposase [Arthrobacter sp. U41]
MTPDHTEILAWIVSLPSPVRVVYEAGTTGFGLAWFLLAAGVDTLVATPSKLQRPSGDRVITEANDALHLARLLKLGEITAVRIPSADQEAARDLVRAREDARGDLMRFRHRKYDCLPRCRCPHHGHVRKDIGALPQYGTDSGAEVSAHPKQISAPVLQA